MPDRADIFLTQRKEQRTKGGIVEALVDVLVRQFMSRNVDVEFEGVSAPKIKENWSVKRSPMKKQKR